MKGLAKKIPVAGIVAGTVFCVEKAYKGNWGAAGA